MGLFETINFLYGKYFAIQRKLMIFIALLCPCFTIFHFIKYIISRFTIWLTKKLNSILIKTIEQGFCSKVLLHIFECINICKITFTRLYTSCINYCKKGKVEDEIEITKTLVLKDKELVIKPDQFYFDSDVIKLNQYLSGNTKTIEEGNEYFL
jgi:hypothetical protein